MTIGLDATYSLGESLSGVGIYSRNLMLALAAAHPETRFQCHYRPHRYLRSWAEPLPPNLTRRLLLDWSIRPPGLFHGLNQRLPRFRARRTVATFHDLFVMTGDYSTPEFRARFTAQARDAARRSDAIIAVSAFTARQVKELLGGEASRIHVVPHGVRELACPAVPREKIVLNVGAVQVRKNIARLVEAFESLDASWRLVLAGSAGYGSAQIVQRIERSPARERIRILGYVSPDQLAGCYARASIFAFPSLDEGFGMPVLEAMAAGVPVITSNRSALPEVAGDAALLVDPEDAGAIAGALRSLAAEESLRAEWARRGRERVRDFTWEIAAARSWEVYCSLADGRG